MIDLKGNIVKQKQFIAKVTNNKSLSGGIREGSRTGGTNDYNKLVNKPSINGVELSGDLTSEILKLQSLMQPLSNYDIEEMFK